jgi:hypothetical protein
MAGRNFIDATARGHQPGHQGGDLLPVGQGQSQPVALQLQVQITPVELRAMLAVKLISMAAGLNLVLPGLNFY